MKLFFAGCPGGGNNEALWYAAGLKHRLVSYIDLIERDGGGIRGLKTEAFWLNATHAEREALVKLYVAGNGKSNGSSERDHGAGLRHRLLSYAFIDDWAKQEFEFWITARPQEVSVFLDSGAFSAYTLGRVIDFGKYCDYVVEHRDALAAYAVLDVIGNAKETAVNLQAMRDRGLDPVSIYHVGNGKIENLRALLQDRPNYIALGGMASDRPTREEIQGKLDACFHEIEPYWPVKVHGLGVLAQWALERYPFYSADGSSAIVGAGMGRVMRWVNGQITSEDWRDDTRMFFDGAVADGVGRTGEKSQSAHEGRRIVNIRTQIELERYITDLWAARGVTWNS